MAAPKMKREKLHLGLRKIKVEKEIEQKKWSQDVKAILREFVAAKKMELRGIYNQVLRFIQAQQAGSFWKDDGCATLDEWLARRDLPNGATLARREIIVRLFDEETFITAGDDILGEMTFLVARYQPDRAKRRHDYQAIFNAYLKSHDTFDKSDFRKTLNWYINTNYVPKEQRTATRDNTARPPKDLPEGRHRESTTEPTEDDGLARDVEVRERDYPGISELREQIALRDEYIAALEKFITSELGAKRLPPRPEGITGL